VKILISVTVHAKLMRVNVNDVSTPFIILPTLAVYSTINYLLDGNLLYTHLCHMITASNSN